MHTLAHKIKKLRKLAGYTQQELADRSTVSLGSLKRFETSGKISLESLLKLAHVLGRLEDFESLFIVDEELINVAKKFEKG